MANLVTLTQVREDIRERMQLPTFGASTAVTTTAINRLINKALRAYAALRAELYGDGYQLARADITATASVLTTALPTGAQNVLKLYWLRTTTDPVEIRLADIDGYSELYRQTPQNWSRPRYRLEGANILWLPTPLATYSVKLLYTLPNADLVADGDTFDGGYEGDEWVVSWVCIRLAQREKRDDDLKRYTAYMLDCEQRIRAHAANRSETEAPQIRDTLGRGLDTYALRDAVTLDPWIGWR
jgi:hypothetical protein